MMEPIPQPSASRASKRPRLLLSWARDLLLALVFSAGDDFGEVDGEALGFGEGEAVFSVVTETLVSEGDAVGFSDAVASGEAAGEGLDSSCARVKGTAARTRAVRARMIVFICVFLFLRAEGHPIGVHEAGSSHLTKANSAIQSPPLASRVLLSS